MKNKLLLISVLSFLYISCNLQKEESITGLWLVEKVKVGSDTMTPVARWIQFNKDSTQFSGNGWLKHSFGGWQLNNSNLLTMMSTNGLLDTGDPFLISLKNNKMIWKRKEENQVVKVYLSKIDVLPTSPGNKLFGLWKLQSQTNEGKDISEKENPNNNQTLYLSWDNVFREHNLLSGKRTGVYKIHGHKPELQMVSYGGNSNFTFWNFNIQDSSLTLTSRDKKEVKKYQRIYKFLQ